MFNPCFEHCYIRYGKEYTPDCDNKCDYARTARDLRLIEEELHRPVNTLGELAIRCCEMLECKNCPVHIHNFDKRTEDEKQMLHIPCVTNLYKWIVEQAKNPNEFEGM